MKLKSVLIVKFKATNRTCCFNFTNAKEFNVGDTVFLKTNKKSKTATIVFLNKVIEPSLPLLNSNCIRKVTKKDLVTIKKVENKKHFAKICFLKRVRKYNFNLKLMDVNYSLAKNKVTFFIKSTPGFLNFNLQNLLKEISCVLKSSVSFRQISSRDEARRGGGVGPCGRFLCCSTFLEKFEPITSKMAANQNLPASSFKAFGYCGKLFCCIKYEDEYYNSSDAGSCSGVLFSKNLIQSDLKDV